MLRIWAIIKFRNFLKFRKVESKKKPPDLVSNPSVNPLRVPEIGKNLRGRKRKRLRLSVTIWERGYMDINLYQYTCF